ncbi:MAG: hypothetical protein EPO12_03955 [Aquabacterium sp.]|nr:MAG: hypothetical protein EPO12_03955 [Aquabacterium sp.]
MKAVLLAGALLNFWGALRLALWPLPGTSHRADAAHIGLLQLFAAGTAAVFGALYLLLWLQPGWVLPFLVFGAALKSWACVISLFLHGRGRIGSRLLVQFGLSNGIVGALFWVVIVHEAAAR